MSDDHGDDDRPSWTALLASHPIFDRASRNEFDESLPPSPGLRAIPKTPRRSSESALELSDADLSHAVDTVSRVGQRAVMAIVRNTELVVAVGKELRILDLADLKAKGEGSSAPIPTYKTLYTPAIDFQIQALTVSPNNSKMLAVVGHSQIVIVIVPRKEWTGLITKQVECQAHALAPFHHNSAATAIAQAVWHPLGYKGATLCVLTCDAVVREYQVDVDIDLAVSTIDFSQESLVENISASSSSRRKSKQSTPRRSPGRTPNTSFFSDGFDKDAGQAVALCFGSAASAWSALTAYCLMRDGSMYAVCPYLPTAAVVSQTNLNRLRAWLDVTPAKDSINSRHAQATPTKNSISSIRLANRRSQQLKFVENLFDEAADFAGGPEVERGHARISITAATNSLPKLRRQGPFLLQPAPAELEGDAESNATALLHLVSTLGDREQGIFCIAYSDGKIDICLDIEPIEARWEPQNESELPVLLAYESLDLGLGSSTNNDIEDSLSENVVKLLTDPVYQNSFLAHHSLGAHSISMSPWLDLLLPALASNDEHAMANVLATQRMSAIKTELCTISDNRSVAVSGALIVRDVYLGNALLLLTSTLQLVAAERPLISAASPVQEIVHSSVVNIEQDVPAYVSLLSKPFFEPIAPLNQPANTRGAARFSIPNAEAKEFEVTPSSLRALGQTVTSIRTSIRDLVNAGNGVQIRLESQCRELVRQLEKMSVMRQDISQVNDSSQLASRIAAAEATQKDLLKRADHILQRLMQAHEPDLSMYEQEWFAELGQLEQQAVKSDRALANRCKQLYVQLDALRQKSAELSKVALNSDFDKMGRSQLARFQVMLELEASSVQEARAKAQALSARFRTG